VQRTSTNDYEVEFELGLPWARLCAGSHGWGHMESSLGDEFQASATKKTVGRCKDKIESSTSVMMVVEKNRKGKNLTKLRTLEALRRQTAPNLTRYHGNVFYI
jgi:hypothetical protein